MKRLILLLFLTSCSFTAPYIPEKAYDGSLDPAISSPSYALLEPGENIVLSYDRNSDYMSLLDLDAKAYEKDADETILKNEHLDLSRYISSNFPMVVDIASADIDADGSRELILMINNHLQGFIGGQDPPNEDHTRYIALDIDEELVPGDEQALRFGDSSFPSVDEGRPFMGEQIEAAVIDDELFLFALEKGTIIPPKDKIHIFKGVEGIFSYVQTIETIKLASITAGEYEGNSYLFMVTDSSDLDPSPARGPRIKAIQKTDEGFSLIGNVVVEPQDPVYSAADLVYIGDPNQDGKPDFNYYSNTIPREKERLTIESIGAKPTVSLDDSIIGDRIVRS